MLFQSAAAVIVACAAHASAKPAPQPYKLAMMSVSGLSLMKRDTFGYQPEETVCGKGDTCEEACGSGFQQCASNDSTFHCFNTAAAQTCCPNNSGYSCDAGYYCTSDSKSETWCCPDAMDLAECAAAYSITGGLEIPKPTTSEAPSTVAPSPTPEPTTSTTPVETPISSCTTSVWHSVNSTTTSHTHTHVETSSSVVLPPPEETSEEPDTPEQPGTPGAASASGVSFALLVAAAGFVGLF